VINCSGSHFFFSNPDINIPNDSYSADIDVFSASTINQKFYRMKYLLQQINDVNKYVAGSFVHAGVNSFPLPYTLLPNQFFIPQNIYSSSGTANAHFTTSSCNDGGVTALNPLRLAGPQQIEEISTVKTKSQIYPNPTQSDLLVRVKTNRTINGYQLEVYNTNGVRVINLDIPEIIEAESEINQPLSLGSYENGVYFIRVLSKGEVLHTESVLLKK
jgi:hypothetical protein